MPAPALRADVECLWAVWDGAALEQRPPERIVPDGCPELILHLGDPFLRQDRSGCWRAQPRAFLAGTLSRPWLLRAGTRPRTLGIRFRPGAAARLLDLPMHESVDRELPLADGLGRAGVRLLEMAAAAPTIAAAQDAAESWLLQRQAAPSRRASTAGPALQLIQASRGQARMAEVARALGWSRRRLQRAFEHELGVTPKLYARIVRLNAVLAALDPAERGGGMDLALDAGYFDQPHLLRDFRDLAGASPQELGRAPGELSRQLTRPERLRGLFTPD